MTISIDLDPGGTPSNTADMGLTKTVSVDTPFTRVIIIEAKCGANWIPVPGLRFESRGTKSVDALFQEVRVAGNPPDETVITISAENSPGMFVDLPSGGAAIDTDALGAEKTILVKARWWFPIPWAKLKVQTSDDNVNWVTVLETWNDRIEHVHVVARWMRADYRGWDASSSVCVGATDQPAIAGQPLTDIVWRPEATGQNAPGGNVFTEWEDAYAAIEAVRNQGGEINLWFDARFSTISTDTDPVYPPFSGNKVPRGMMIPKGTWDMSNVVWKCSWDAFGNNPLGSKPTVFFEDHAYIEHLATISFSFGYLRHDGTVHTPIRGSLSILSEHCEMYNTHDEAWPMVEPEIGAKNTDTFFFVVKGNSKIGRRRTSPAPLVNGGKTTFRIVCEGGEFANNIFTQDPRPDLSPPPDTVAPPDANPNPGPSPPPDADPAAGYKAIIMIAQEGAQGSHQWLQPKLLDWEITSVRTHGNQWKDWNGGTLRADTDHTVLDEPLKYNHNYTVDTSRGDFAVKFPTAQRVFGDPITIHNVGSEGLLTVTPFPAIRRQGVLAFPRIKEFPADTVEYPYVPAGQSKTWEPNKAGTWVLVAGNDLGRNMNPTPITAPETAEYGSIILVDSSGGDFDLNFPTAARKRGEPITVVNIEDRNNPGNNAVTCIAPSQTVDNPEVAAEERKTWAPDGVDTWRQIS